MKKLTLIILALAFGISIFAQDRGFVTKRIEAKDHIALIIGNSAYPDMPLENPKNDANDVAEVFKDMGFIVDKLIDADKEQMSMAIDRFSNKLRTARVTVFYFAGHGMQVDGENYLIPIGHTAGTQITKEEQVAYRAINAGEVLAAMESQKVKFSLIVLDACRNNPIKGSGRGKLKGLASIDAPAGSLVMYSTKAGDVAADGTDKNSPFTTAFLKHITTPGLDVNLLPSRVTKTVRELTNNVQTPGSYVQITQSFTFVPELTAAELEQIRKQQQGKLTELQKREAEIKRQQDKEDAEMARKQAEINALEKQIKEMKNQAAVGEGDLDKMLQVIEQRKKQKTKLDALRKKAEEDRLRRKKEIYEMKLAKFNKNIAKYNRIANSEYGQDMKPAAWNTVLKNLGLAKGSVKIGDITGLKYKFYDIPTQIIDLRDGKIYKTVWIGNQIWMQENLAFMAHGGSWAYNSSSDNVKKYGYLYNWETAKTVCPTGWHLPTKAEFETLLNNYGGTNGYKANYTALIPGGESGFSASFGGWRDSNSKYKGIGEYGYFWSSSAQGNGSSAWKLDMSSKLNKGSMSLYGKRWAFSVRCVQNN